MTAVLEHETGALDVGAERVLELVEAGAQPRKVQHVGEVVRQVAEVAGREVDRAHRHPGRLELLTRRERARGGRRGHGGERLLLTGGRLREARNAPHVVLRREVPRERAADRARDAGDEDPFTGDHRNRRE